MTKENELEKPEVKKRKRWSWSMLFVAVFSISVLLAPVAFIYVLNNGNPYENFWVERNVPKHLEEMGIKETDILEQATASPKHLINSDYYHTHYIVKFKDEPNLEYMYGVKKWGKDVVQFCEKEQLKGENNYIGDTKAKTKHSEKTCVSIYANRD